MNIGLAMLSALRSFLMMINTSIYSLVATLYSLFIDIATWDILENSDIVEGITQRVGLILILFMVFKLSFSLIQTLIDPDDKAIKGSTKLVTRTVIVLVLFATINTIFTEAKELQRIVVAEDNVIYKIILGNNSTNQDEDFTNFGNNLATDTFFSFYTDDEAPNLDADIMSSNTIGGCSTPEECYQIIKTENYSGLTFLKATDLVNETDDDDNYIIEFDGWTAIAVGIFMLYIMISYILSVGVRTVQLAFLQIIAPIPLLSYLSPKDETAFHKWIKMCITTYVDVFIRLAIIFFAVFLIQNLNDIDLGPDRGLSMKLVLVLSILMFAKQAPKLLSELFPESLGSIGMGLGVGSKLKEMAGFGLVTGAVGAAGAAALGGAVGAISNIANERRNFTKNWTGWSGKERLKNILAASGSAIGGLGSGFGRGLFSGYKNGIKGGPLGIGKAGMSAASASSKARNARDQGYNIRDRVYDYATDVAGLSKEMGTTSEIKNRIKGLREQMANFQRDEQNHSEALRTIATANDGAKYADYYKAFERKLLVDEDGKPILDGNKNFQYDYNYSDYNDFIQANPTSTLTRQEYNQYQATMNYRDYADNEARKLNAQINKLEEATSKGKKQ